MQNLLCIGTMQRSPGRRSSRWSGLCLLLLTLILVTGCGKGAGDANSVSGKVTLNNQPVSGTVFFVYSDNKEVTGPINADGSYTIPNPPPGQVKVLVKGLPGTAAPAPPTKGPALADPGGTSAAKGVSPPPKYGNPQTSDLTYEVKPGKHTHNIELKP